ncbi:MAG: hypothetical protein IPH35_25240 [Rhodoferax sp.]|nr:hypothetical protein [Rhodoferax sp.]
MQTQAQTQTRFVLQSCDGLADAIEHADTAKIVAACVQYTASMGQFGMETGSIDTLVWAASTTHLPPTYCAAW